MSKEVNVDIGINVDEGNLNAALEKAELVASAEVKARREVERTVRAAAGVANSMIGLFRNMLSIMGVTLDAFSGAMLQVIQQVISLAVAWAALETAMAVGSFGLTAVGAGVAAFALGIAIGQAVYISQHGDAAQSKINAALGALGNLQGIATGLDQLL